MQKRFIIRYFFIKTLRARKRFNLPSMNKHRAEYGEELLNFAMPVSPRTISNMTYLEAVQVMHTALPIVE